MTPPAQQSDTDEPGVADRNLSDVLAPHLPYLRRFARALCGRQEAGDAYVAAVLEALIADRTVIDLDLPPRVALYRLFHQIWAASGGADRDDRSGLRRTPHARRYLLLTAVEEFTPAQAATILDISAHDATTLADEARDQMAAQTSARVAVIEDEPIIALDLESIVRGLGHSVAGVADTHESAVELVNRTEPDLILADIQLADDSSGIDAVREILAERDVPVIFITAFPERLLTGERPEPTYLVTKPFRPQTVETAVSQALFHADPT